MDFKTVITKLTTLEVETIPRNLENGFIYVSRKYATAIHLCACGCGNQTVTPFNDSTTGWVLTDTQTGITLRPSIGNQNFPCKSHYFITAGSVQPC